MIEKMAEAGELTDDQGQKLTDLTKLSFSHDLSEDFQTLIDKLDEFIDKISGPGGLGDSLKNLPQPVQLRYQTVLATVEAEIGNLDAAIVACHEALRLAEASGRAWRKAVVISAAFW